MGALLVMDPPAISLLQGPLQATVVSKGQYAPSSLLQSPMGPQIGAEEGQGTPGIPQSGAGGLGMPTLPQFPLGAEGLGCPDLSPPHLYPQTAESPGDVAAGTELGEWGGDIRGEPGEEGGGGGGGEEGP